MKGYYIGGGVLAFLLFIVLFFVSMIGTCTGQNAEIDEVENYGKTTVVLRYYTDEDEDSAIVYRRVKKNSYFTISNLPQKFGYTFLGYYTHPQGGSQYVDASGNSLYKLTDDILLYPLFEQNNGPLEASFTLLFEHPYGSVMSQQQKVTMGEDGQIDLSTIDYSAFKVDAYALGGFKYGDEILVDANGKLVAGKKLEDVWNKTLTAHWVFVGGNN